jgi:hypothetical protein
MHSHRCLQRQYDLKCRGFRLHSEAHDGLFFAHFSYLRVGLIEIVSQRAHCLLARWKQQPISMKMYDWYFLISASTPFSARRWAKLTFSRSSQQTKKENNSVIETFNLFSSAINSPFYPKGWNDIAKNSLSPINMSYFDCLCVIFHDVVHHKFLLCVYWYWPGAITSCKGCDPHVFVNFKLSATDEGCFLEEENIYGHT